MWVAIVLFCAGNSALASMDCKSAVVDQVLHPTREECIIDTMRKASVVNQSNGPVLAVVVPGSICMQVQ